MKYQIAVSLISGVGDVIGKKLIAYCGSAEAVFSEGVKALNKIPGIGSKLSKIIKESDTLDRAEQELTFMDKQGVKMVFYADKNYPYRLKQLLFANPCIRGLRPQSNHLLQHCQTQTERWASG